MADPDYERFRSLAVDLARDLRTSIEMVFEPIGLMVQPENSNFDYWCTPTNSVTFATTGGDGVHFGLLAIAQEPVHPVVMTVPMADTQNLVVAPTFHEFLRLGYFVGFFSLEQFVYQWDEAARFHACENPETGLLEKMLLKQLRSAFALEPVADIGAQVRATDKQYAEHLQVPEIEEWNARHGV